MTTNGVLTRLQKFATFRKNKRMAKRWGESALWTALQISIIIIRNVALKIKPTFFFFFFFGGGGGEKGAGEEGVYGCSNMIFTEKSSSVFRFWPKGRRRVIIRFGETLQTSAIVWTLGSKQLQNSFFNTLQLSPCLRITSPEHVWQEEEQQKGRCKAGAHYEELSWREGLSLPHASHRWCTQGGLRLAASSIISRRAAQTAKGIC